MTDYEEVWEDLEVEVTGNDTQRLSIVVGIVENYWKCGKRWLN